MEAFLVKTGEVGDTFGHPRKRTSINQVMANRLEYFEGFTSAWSAGAKEVVEFCETLPHIGGITKRTSASTWQNPTFGWRGLQQSQKRPCMNYSGDCR